MRIRQICFNDKFFPSEALLAEKNILTVFDHGTLELIRVTKLLRSHCFENLNTFYTRRESSFQIRSMEKGEFNTPMKDSLTRNTSMRRRGAHLLNQLLRSGLLPENLV